MSPPRDPRALFDITGRRTLVTGASRGIGRALAQGLAAAGAEVTITARTAGPLGQARDEIAATTGATVHALAFDAADADAAERGLCDAVEAMGGLDVLVNNAGIQFRSPITDFPTEQWHRLLETNLSTAFMMSRAAARVMIGQASGKIINICSVQSDLARPGIAAYAATKGAMKMLTKGLCADLGPYGIQVNGLAPGYFDTELTAALVADAQFSAWVARRTPAGRWGKVEDLLGTLIFLASAASDFVNGQVVFVDGGMTSVL